MTFYVFAWIANILYGFVTIIGKLTTKYAIKNPWLFNFCYLLFLLIFTFPIAISQGVSIPVKWGNLTVASLLLAIALTLYSLALYKLDASVISPLYNLRVPFSLLFSVIILGEILTKNQYFLILIMFLAGLFITIDENMSLGSFFQKPVAMVFFSTIFVSLMAVYVKKAIADVGYWNFSLWSLIIAQGILLVTLPLFMNDLRTISKKQIGILVVLSLFDTLATLANNRALEVNVSITATILAVPTGMILAYLLSIFAPKLLERHTQRVYAIRFAAAAVIIIVALKLSG